MRDSVEIQERPSNIVTDRARLRVKDPLNGCSYNTFKISEVPDMDPVSKERSDVLRVNIPRFGVMGQAVAIENGFGDQRVGAFCEISNIWSEDIIKVMEKCKVPPVIAVHLIMNKGMSYEEIAADYGVRKDSEETPILIAIFGPSMQGKSLASGIFCTANKIPLIDLDGFVEDEGSEKYAQILEGVDWGSKDSTKEALRRVQTHYQEKGESSWNKERPKWNVWMALDKLCEDFKQICSGDELPKVILCDMHGFRLSENEEEMKKWNPLDLLATESMGLTFEAFVNYGVNGLVPEPEITAEVMDSYITMMETVILGDQNYMLSKISKAKKMEMISVLRGNENEAIKQACEQEALSAELDLWMSFVFQSLREEAVI